MKERDCFAALAMTLRTPLLFPPADSRGEISLTALLLGLFLNIIVTDHVHGDDFGGDENHDFRLVQTGAGVAE